MDNFNAFSCMNCPNRRNSIFKDLHSDTLKSLDLMKTIVKVKKGGLIFKEGSLPKGLYCIQSGKVKITQKGPDGKEQVIHLLNKGDVIGHRAIFGDDEFSCSASTMENTNICFFPREQFCKLVETNNPLVLRIAQLLAGELKETEKMITSAAQKSVPIRVAECLLLLKSIYGYESDNQTLDISFTRAELANIVGTTRETITRTLYKLASEKMINLNKKKIIILNERKLSSFRD